MGDTVRERVLLVQRPGAVLLVQRPQPAQLVFGAGVGGGGGSPALTGYALDASLQQILTRLMQTLSVSAASLPLPANAATESSLAAARASLANIDTDALQIVVNTASILAAIQALPQQQALTNAQLRASALPLPTGAATEGTLAAANGHLANIDTDALQLVVNSGSLLNRLPTAPLLDRMKSSDQLTGEEYLDDQPGTGGILPFNFTAAPDLAWVRSVGGISRATFGTVDPTSTKGVYCAADEPTPITCSGKLSLRVWAPAGAIVSVWGFRYT